MGKVYTDRTLLFDFVTIEKRRYDSLDVCSLPTRLDICLVSSFLQRSIFLIDSGQEELFVTELVYFETTLRPAVVSCMQDQKQDEWSQSTGSP